MTPTHQQRCPLGPGLEAAEIAATLELLGQDPEVERVVLFGSRARGNARSESDLDLLLIVTGSLTLEREKRLRRGVRNLLLPPQADGWLPLACARPHPPRRGATRCRLKRTPAH